MHSGARAHVHARSIRMDSEYLMKFKMDSEYLVKFRMDSEYLTKFGLVCSACERGASPEGFGGAGIQHS